LVEANIEVYCYMIVWRFLEHSEWRANGVECSAVKSSMQQKHHGSTNEQCSLETAVIP
jgi:hypothetical protein